MELKSHAALDQESRIKKAQKIEDILGLGKKNKSVVLDVGTGAGYIPAYLGKNHKVTSIDIVDERVVKDNFKFVKTDDASLPVKTGAFPIVLSNQVIEHIPEQQKHVEELKRATKSGGKVYIATPNRYWIVDPHTKLPFINWMPRKLADIYSTKLGKGRWDVFPVGYFGLKRMIEKEGLVIEQTSYDVLNRIEGDTSIKGIYRTIYKLIPGFILNFFKFLYPSTIFIVKKK